MDKLRIFLADDHAVVRAGLKTLVNAQADMVVVGEAGDGQAALEQVRDCVADVVIMDISMPQLNGAAATAQLRQQCPDIKVLALSVHEDTGYLRRLLEAGASGYVLKRSAASELVMAIREVMQGRSYVTSLVTEGLVGSLINTDARKAGGDLTLRQREVLQLLAEGRSMKEIAGVLNLTPRTVAFHKYRMMEQLKIKSTAELIQYAVKHNIV